MHEYLLLFYSEIILKSFLNRVACKVDILLEKYGVYAV